MKITAMKTAATTTVAMTLAMGILLTPAAFAQMELPKPGPEHKKLDMFAGSWSLEGDMKASAMSPAGKITEDEKCEWMDGNFFLICHTNFEGSLGSGTGVSILGYSGDDKVYTYREFNSWGEFDDSKGTVDGDTWTWTSDEKMGGKTMKGKFTMKIVAPTSYTFMFEMSPDGTNWTTVMDGKATKK
jgi:hypothetical protein